jgi:hypothetical protein
MIALRNSLPDFLIASGPGDLWRQFLRDRLGSNLGQLQQLPKPQRNALDVALGRPLVPRGADPSHRLVDGAEPYKAPFSRR